MATVAPLRLVGFSGSLRAKSCNAGLLRAAAKHLPKYDASLKILDINFPLFNEDLEGTDGSTIPAAVAAFRAEIAAADGIVFGVPEYNYSIAAPLKNAIDWASRSYGGKPQPFAGKPCVFMGTGGGMGTSRAQQHLLGVARFLDLRPMQRPEMTVARWVAGGTRFDADGNLTDASTDERLDKQMSAFARWVRVLQAGEAAVAASEKM